MKPPGDPGLDPRLLPVKACLRGELRLAGSSSPGARTIERPGLLASVAPAAPDRSLFNAVVYDDSEVLLECWEELDQLYVGAGVRAWTVWVHPGEAATKAELRRRGHTFDGAPHGMVGHIASMPLAPEEGLDWSETRDVGLVARLNDAAYGVPAPAFLPALEGSKLPGWRAYVARVGGEPVACVATHDEGDVLGVSLVATAHSVRGQRVASRLLSAALREGLSRGLPATSLVASSLGRGLYERLGYEDLGAFEMWEHRR